jgi:hypothetical protein
VGFLEWLLALCAATGPRLTGAGCRGVSPSPLLWRLLPIDGGELNFKLMDLFNGRSLPGSAGSSRLDRGQRDAPRMGERLAKPDVKPDLILSNLALRALATAEVIANVAPRSAIACVCGAIAAGVWRSERRRVLVGTGYRSVRFLQRGEHLFTALPIPCVGDSWLGAPREQALAGGASTGGRRTLESLSQLLDLQR